MGQAPPALGDTHQSPRDGARARVAIAMRRASAASTLHSQAVARRVGLSPVDLECLDLIQIGGPATPGQIRQRTGLSSGAVTGVVDRLERLGLVRREADASDRRKVLVHIVPEQLGSIEALYQPMQAAFDALLSEYSEIFLEQVATFIERGEKLTIEHVASLSAQKE